MAHACMRNGIWYVRYKDPAGTWRRKSCSANANRVDASALEKVYTAKELNYLHKAPVRIVKAEIEGALTDFRDRVLKQGANGNAKEESSVRREQTVVDTFLAFLKKNGHKDYKQVGERAVQDFMDERARAQIGAKTKREERRVLRKFFRWSMQQYYTTENPAENVAVPKLQRKKPRFFSAKELKKIGAAATDRYRAIFSFMYLTGLRSGEVANLQWRDYDKANRLLTVRVVSADRSKRMPGNKTKREETIPVSKAAAKILEERKKAGESDRFVFLNEFGNPLDDDNIYRNLKRALKKAEINDASPHTFRHTFASHLVIGGVSIYTVKELLRHKSIRETEIYAHLSKEATRKAVEALKLKG